MDHEAIIAEVSAIAEEIKFAVKSVQILDGLTSLKVVIQEGQVFDLQLSARGLHVLSSAIVCENSEDNTANCNCNAVGKTYETVSAFLTEVSPYYKIAFAEAVSHKLSALPSHSNCNNNGKH